MPNLIRCRNALLIACLVLATGASAEEEQQEQADETGFARPGFYVAFGGTYAAPLGWDTDVDNDLNEDASDLANEIAGANLNDIDPSLRLVPLEVKVDGADVEDGFWGVNGVVGYRVEERVAFEVEAEWLSGSNKSSLDVEGSSGTHTIEIEEIWAITANVKIYPPLTGRFQPFGVVGLGLQNSRLEVDMVTSGLTTTDEGENVVVSADFQVRSRKNTLDGVVRLGGGIDMYATENVAVELNATYVLPFVDVGGITTTDYLSVGWRLKYRF